MYKSKRTRRVVNVTPTLRVYPDVKLHRHLIISNINENYPRQECIVLKPVPTYKVKEPGQKYSILIFYEMLPEDVCSETHLV